MATEENYNLEQASYSKIIGNTGQQRREAIFYGGKEKVGRAVINKKSTPVNWEYSGFLLAELRVSHWLGCCQGEEGNIYCFYWGGKVIAEALRTRKVCLSYWVCN